MPHPLQDLVERTLPLLHKIPDDLQRVSRNEKWPSPDCAQESFKTKLQEQGGPLLKDLAVISNAEKGHTARVSRRASFNVWEKRKVYPKWAVRH